MRLAVSIPNNFKNYTALCDILKEINFDELVAFENELITSYAKEFNKPVQFFKINWGDIKGASNIQTNQFGKQYNGDAPKIAAKKIIEYATDIIEIDGGDSNLNTLAKQYNLKHIPVKKIKQIKRYKF